MLNQKVLKKSTDYFAEGHRSILIILNVWGSIVMNDFNIISHKGKKS